MIYAVTIPTVCEIEALPMVFYGTAQTLVGYGPFELGHNHDDNCRTRIYRCANGHEIGVRVRNTCPACDWKGKLTCFCHDGEKVEL